MCATNMLMRRRLERNIIQSIRNHYSQTIFFEH
uniref:Uncharacterized protein n=1 Tax=Ascaris lumbricoides TaxID=6252 RepID=A0A0M3IC30_ASCLU